MTKSEEGPSGTFHYSFCNEIFDRFGTRVYGREGRRCSLGLYLRLLHPLRIATQGLGIGEWSKCNGRCHFFNLMWKDGLYGHMNDTDVLLTHWAHTPQNLQELHSKTRNYTLCPLTPVIFSGDLTHDPSDNSHRFGETAYCMTNE